MSTLTEAQAKEWATLITASRRTFATFFDAEAARLGGEYLDFKLVALGKTNNGAAFAAAIASAAERGFLQPLIKALIEVKGLDTSGVKVSEAGLVAFSPSLQLTPQEAGSYSFTAQGWKKDMVNLISVDAMLAAVVTASRRVCCIMIDKHKVGSGFLVGPQTIITNWHVVHDLIDSSGGQEPQSERRLRCVFDYLDDTSSSSYAPAPEWLVDWSPMAVGSGPTRTQDFPDRTNLKPHALDYCVVRLQGAPGRSRGWYDLAKSGDVGGENRPFFVIQHPERMEQHVGIATQASLDGERIKHLAATLGGSSGGLCLNEKFELVGLHQGQITKVIGGQISLDTNVAIRTSAIGAICAEDAASVVQAYDAIWVTRKNRLAVVGRGATLANIMEMRRVDTTTPILAVRGEPGSGKRFTIELVEDRLSYADQWFARLDAASLPSSATEMADLILRQAGVPEELRAGLPVATDATTTDAAWIREPLFREFRQIVETVAEGRILWIVMENLDRVDIVQSGARRFLDVLYAMAPNAKSIRIILLGLQGGVPAANSDTVIYEDLLHPDNLLSEEIEDFIGYVCVERGVAATKAEIGRLAGLVTSASASWPAGSSPGRLARLGNLLSKVVYPESENWT